MKGMEVHITKLTETNENDEYAMGGNGRDKVRETERRSLDPSPPSRYLDSLAI